MALAQRLSDLATAVGTDIGALQKAVTAGVTFQSTAAENLNAGQPVYILKTNGQAKKASASVYQQAFVAGLVVHDVQVGFVAQIATESITLTDWTAIAGTATLQAGNIYFLAAGGGITTTAPMVAGGAIMVVGVAVSASKLNIKQTNPILI